MKAILWETQLKSQRTDGDATLAPTNCLQISASEREAEAQISRIQARCSRARELRGHVHTDAGESEPARATGRRRETRGSYLLPRREAAAAEGSGGHAWGRIPARRRRGSPGLPSFLPAAGRRGGGGGGGGRCGKL